MKKYIKIVTALAFISVIALQGIWLANTYRMQEERLKQIGNQVFPKAAVEEAIHRINTLRGEEHISIEAQASWDQSPTDGEGMVELVCIELNHYSDSIFNVPVSLAVLDSIFTQRMAEEGYQAKAVYQEIDSAGVLLQQDGDFTAATSHHILTDKVFLDRGHTKAVQAIILNPYWLIFQKMGILLVATAIFILFIAYCIAYQIQIISRQNRIARIRQDFTYAMIHDMKTPIGTIAMAGQALESGKLDKLPELKARYFAILREETEHLQQLSEKILTIAKLEQSHLKLVTNQVDLKPMLEELALKYKVKTPKKANFIIDCPCQPFLADREYLREAISNLIDNSLKYSGEEVTIRLSAEEKNGWIEIKVWDNGWGIPQKAQKHIFEKFQRGGMEYRKERKIAGFGLGLNYVLRVVTAMNGTVSVRSEEGKFSEFTLSLPL